MRAPPELLACRVVIEGLLHSRESGRWRQSVFNYRAREARKKGFAKKMKKNMMMVSALVLALAASPAFAETFVRGELGRANVDVNTDDFGNDSDNDTAWSIRGGWYFNKNFAVEGFYSDFYDQSISVDDGAGGSIDANAKFNGWGVGVVGKTDFGNDQTGFFLSGRAGLMRGKVSASVTGFGHESDTSTKPYFGVGLGYDFTPKWGMSLNYDHQKASSDDLSVTANTLTVGVEARF